LYGFLLGHLTGNMLLLLEDGGAAFNAYSDFLVNHPLLLPVELGLVAIFVLHIYFAVSVSRDNRRARPIGYGVSKAVGGRSWASRSMIWTGSLILVFVVLHLKTFKYGEMGDGTLYDLVVETFRDRLYAAWYVAAMLLLGVHLWHAFGSAFQTLGLYARPKLRAVSIILCIIISGGFTVIPVWIFLSQ
jgi:succinate dehydrogenase / fumarate reductase cytochrome b subunit